MHVRPRVHTPKFGDSWRYLVIALLVCGLSGFAALPTLAQTTAAPSKKLGRQAQPRWTPSESPENLISLPKRFDGDNQKQVLGDIKAFASTRRKSEFETSAAYAERVAAQTEQFAKGHRMLALSMPDAQFEYNADTQSYVPAQHSYVFATDGDDAVVSLDIVLHELDKYEGSNAYGSSREISRLRINQLALRLPKARLAPSQLAVSVEGVRRSMKFGIQIPADVADAKRNAGRRVRALFIGSIPEPKMVEVVTLFVSPTLSGPDDTIVRALSVPFDLKYVVFYFYETGEVIGSVTL